VLPTLSEKPTRGIRKPCRAASVETDRTGVVDAGGSLANSGDETVLDAGCGSGRVTQALIKRLPRGRVIAVDGSAVMIAAARRRLGDSAELILSDLFTLDLGGAPGRLVAQCGGAGNTPELLAATLAVVSRPPFSPYLQGWSPWNFAGPRETKDRLRAAGFTHVLTELVRRPAPYEHLREWLETNALSADLLASRGSPGALPRRG
jgi:trans-aconitate 2-methyltransferase